MKILSLCIKNPAVSGSYTLNYQDIFYRSTVKAKHFVLDIVLQENIQGKRLMTEKNKQVF